MVLLSGHSGFWIHPNKISSNQDWIYEMSTGRYDTSPASQRLLSIQAVIVISMNYSCSNQVWTIWHGQKFLQMNQICSGIIQLLQHCFVLIMREKPHSTEVVVLENVFLSNFRLHLIILFSTLPKAKSLEYPWLNTAVAYKAVDWTLCLIFKKIWMKYPVLQQIICEAVDIIVGCHASLASLETIFARYFQLSF